MVISGARADLSILAPAGRELRKGVTAAAAAPAWTTSLRPERDMEGEKAAAEATRPAKATERASMARIATGATLKLFIAGTTGLNGGGVLYCTWWGDDLIGLGVSVMGGSRILSCTPPSHRNMDLNTPVLDCRTSAKPRGGWVRETTIGTIV
eukprot:766458-Hanusia_phi.AAC.1